MLVTEVGMVTLVNPVRLLKADAAIVVTVNARVATVKDDCIVMEPVAVVLFEMSTTAVFVAPGVNE
jgi:hypothetical protein